MDLLTTRPVLHPTEVTEGHLQNPTAPKLSRHPGLQGRFDYQGVKAVENDKRAYPTALRSLSLGLDGGDGVVGDSQRCRPRGSTDCVPRTGQSLNTHCSI